MTNFDPGLHTPEALIDELTQLQEAAPAALLVGSLGRAAFYSHVLGDPAHEYRQRRQEPVRSFYGEPMDIDLIGPSEQSEGFGPFKIDPLTLGGRQVNLALEDGVWHLRSQNRGYSAVIDPAVFEPVSAQTVYGAPCNTVPGQTHLALIGTGGTLRPQDIVARRLLTEVTEQDDFATIPPELYYPFEELRKLNQKSPFSRTRAAYRAVVPSAVRRPLAPLLQPVKDRYLR